MKCIIKTFSSIEKHTTNKLTIIIISSSLKLITIFSVKVFEKLVFILDSFSKKKKRLCICFIISYIKYLGIFKT